jgi:uncharacterized protein (DUF433 family)
MTLTFAPEPVPLRIDEHGVARVVGSRITLDTIVDSFENGEYPEKIVNSFPTLKLADVYAIIAYYLRHRPEVDAYMEEGRQQAAALRREIEARFDPRGVRERLLARRAAQTTAPR